MSSQQKLGEISRALNKSIERMDAMQRGKAAPFSDQLRQHIAKNRGNLTNIILAGCVFAVAIGRFNLNQQHQVPQWM
jgi:hypothetical protein